jgi:hypothetical protein
VSFLLFSPFQIIIFFRGIYDYEYMDYTIRVLDKCNDYGFKVIMDPHQDIVRPSLPYITHSLTHSRPSSGLASQVEMALPSGL